jgi:hypothetical protein
MVVAAVIDTPASIKLKYPEVSKAITARPLK